MVIKIQNFLPLFLPSSDFSGKRLLKTVNNIFCTMTEERELMHLGALSKAHLLEWLNKTLFILNKLMLQVPTLLIVLN